MKQNCKNKRRVRGLLVFEGHRSLVERQYLQSPSVSTDNCLLLRDPLDASYLHLKWFTSHHILNQITVRSTDIDSTRK